MSYGGTPWQRNVGSYQQGGPQSMYLQQQYGQNQIASNNIYSSSSNNVMNYSSGGGGNNNSSSGSRMNNSNYSSGNDGGNNVGQPPQHYNSIGTVSKISSDCGLVNDEVFFYRNVIKGPMPKLGDRVLFEANYCSSGQYEWVASRIQQLVQANASPSMPDNMRDSDYNRGRLSLPRRSPMRTDFRRDERRKRERIDSRDREEEQMRKRRHEDHDRNRDRPIPIKKDLSIQERKERDRIERERELHARERDARELRDRNRAMRERNVDRSPHRDVSKVRRAPGSRRYMVQVPKNVLVYKAADIHTLRQRYANLYIPSDFFYARMKWAESFTPDNPFSLRRPCQFHIKHADVEPPFERKLEDLEPADADFLYSAKVMLLSLPTLVEMYQKCLESDEDDGAFQKLHPSRLISFLVGTRGHNEPLAIGGPWSPSLDGPNPEDDPSVLIRTAIRTCRALTGIDLSNCTQWYRFVEFYYHRNEYKNKSKSSNKDSKDEGARIETVVIYLPDIHSCMPSLTEWEKLRAVYKKSCDDFIARKLATAKANASNKTTKDNDDKTATANDDNAQTNPAAASTTSSSTNNKAGKEIVKKGGAGAGAGGGVDGKNSSTSSAKAETGATTNSDDAAGRKAEKNEPIAGDGVGGADAGAGAGDNNKNEKGKNPEATHYSKLDLKTMKLQQIRDELDARGLPSKGAKNALVSRLSEALNEEKEKEEAGVGADAGAGAEENAANEEDEDNKTQSDQSSQVDDNGYDSKQHHTDDIEALKNENSNTNDAGDIDMNDMVVVDEYDSNKQEEPTKELDERKKAWLTRRFTLPDHPYIVVHPNKHAKGGKFDCTTMTLQSLLNYLPGDSKERCFEVYVFAELFNEMLMRDFGFNIYKEIHFSKETVAESQDNKTESNPKQENGTEDKDKDKDEQMEEKSVKTKSTKDKEKEKEKERERERERERDKDKEKVDKKMVIVKPHLLLSFIYFDMSQCGSIFEKDLEELFTTLGLELSRGQIRKTLNKLGNIKSLHYRSITDREEAVNAEPVIEDLNDIPPDELKDFALGNRIYGLDEDYSWETEKSTEATEDGMVNFNGTMVHIGKLMEQINRTEKNYTDIDKLYNDLLKQHSELQKEHARSNNKVKDLQSEVKSLTRKISDATIEITTLNRKYREQQATLQFIFNRVQPYFPRDKDKEKDVKSESSKDKEEKDKEKKKDTKENGGGKEKEKEKDKDKDKDKEAKTTKDEAAKEAKSNTEPAAAAAATAPISAPAMAVKSEKSTPEKVVAAEKSTEKSEKSEKVVITSVEVPVIVKAEKIEKKNGGSVKKDPPKK